MTISNPQEPKEKVKKYLDEAKEILGGDEWWNMLNEGKIIEVAKMIQKESNET